TRAFLSSDGKIPVSREQFTMARMSLDTELKMVLKIWWEWEQEDMWTASVVTLLCSAFLQEGAVLSSDGKIPVSREQFIMARMSLDTESKMVLKNLVGRGSRG